VTSQYLLTKEVANSSAEGCKRLAVSGIMAEHFCNLWGGIVADGKMWFL